MEATQENKFTKFIYYFLNSLLGNHCVLHIDLTGFMSDAVSDRILLIVWAWDLINNEIKMFNRDRNYQGSKMKYVNLFFYALIHRGATRDMNYYFHQNLNRTDNLQ